MTKEIIIAGFGGQGVMSMGKILAYAAAGSGMEVSWMPSYGPEQRGGTANVTVIVSDERISSPIVGQYDIVVALNQQSLTKFESKVKSGGILIYDTYGITEPPLRGDIRIYSVGAMQTAIDNGMQKTFNTLILGAIVGVAPIVHTQSIIGGLKQSLPERYHHLLAANEEAIAIGKQLPKEQAQRAKAA